jgi:hypothetical protein
MIKNLTSHQVLLIAIAAILLLMAAFSFYLLQDPSAPLPFAPIPATATATLSRSTPALTTRPSDTPLPTRQTSYTPFATLLTPPPSANPSTISPGPETAAPNSSQTVTPGTTAPLSTSTKSATPTRTASVTANPATPSITPSPTITDTLSPGEVGVTGRVLRNEIPSGNVSVEFKDDVAPRRSSTNHDGYYWFTSLAPGTAFSLTFDQAGNPALSSAINITSLAWLEGTLPTNISPIITLPDLEISIDLDDIFFELQTPTDGAAYSSAVISSSNKIQFIWNPYTSGGPYHVELGPHGSDQPIWTSSQDTSLYTFWDGKLDNGNHITQGTYWWRVAITRPLGNYTEVIFTQPWDIQFNP